MKKFREKLCDWTRWKLGQEGPYIEVIADLTKKLPKIVANEKEPRVRCLIVFVRPTRNLGLA